MSDEQNKKHDMKKPSETAVKAYLSDQSFKSDPSGSYTGRPKDEKKPEQDADDL